MDASDLKQKALTRGPGLDMLEESVDRWSDEILRKGILQGHAKGRQEGLAEGRQEGLAEGQFDIVSNMARQGLDVQQISTFTGLSPEMVSRLLTKMM